MKAALLRIRALILKELKVLWADPGSRKILIIPILVQSIIFGYGATFNLEHIPYVLLDESGSTQSAELVMQLEGSGYFVRTEHCLTQQCFNEAMAAGRGLIGVHFAPDFAASGRVQIIADARNTASANTAVSYLSTLAASAAESSSASASASASASSASSASSSATAGSLKFNYRYYFNENNITRSGILTGMILGLTVIQVVLLSSLSVAREREDGTFDMLLMTPAGSLEILIGKAAAPTLAAMGQSMALVLICTFWFDIPCRGSMALLILVIFLFALAVVGLGLAVSALAASPQQALIAAFLMVLPCVILSGMLTPANAVTPWFRPIIYINPLYYGIQAVQRIYLEGAGLADIWHLLIPFVFTGLITMPLAMYLFRHRVS